MFWGNVVCEIADEEILKSPATRNVNVALLRILKVTYLKVNRLTLENRIKQPVKAY